MRMIDRIMKIKSKCNFEEEISEAFDLTGREISCICCFNNGLVFSSRDMAGMLGLSASRASRLITRLVEKGYLEEAVDKGDRRFLSISLSKKGQECHDKIEHMKDLCEEELKNKLKPEDFQAIGRGLDALMGIL
ncbi:MAG: MarR family transcriptional regulator [Spirochaetales bacterium]|nr:MarR family transcriptional regulator [Spirochaetales bacterium]